LHQHHQAHPADVLRQIDDAVQLTRGRSLPSGIEDESLSDHLMQWALHWGIVTDDDAARAAAGIRVDGFASYCCHEQPPEVRELIGRLVLWLFLFDDEVGEAPTTRDAAEHSRTLATYLEVARTGEPSPQGSPFQHALRSIRSRAIELGACTDWVERFPIALQRFFSGCQDEAAVNRAARTPGVAEYRELRARSVGMYTVFAMLELGPGGQLSPTEARSPDLFLAQTKTAQLCAWINDLYSYPKEVCEGRSVNLLMTLAKGSTFREALASAVQLYNDDLAAFEAHCSRLTAVLGSPAVAAHVRALTSMIHGNRLWTRRCGRYGVMPPD